MKTKIISLIGFSLATVVVLAQNAADDIRKINLSLSKPEKLAISMAYKVFADSVTTQPMQAEDGKWIKNGAVQYHSLAATETIRKAGEIQVLIDHNNKIVLISNAPVTAGDNPMAIMTTALDDLLKTCKSIQYKNINRELASYDLYPYVSAFSRITIVFDKKTFYPKKMIMVQSTTVNVTEGDQERSVMPRIEVEFKDITTERVQIGQTDFTKYVVKKGSNYELTAPYKEYQLNNYLLTN